MPFKNGNYQKHETRWTPEMINFLKDNFFTMTNSELAKALGLRLTTTRTKCYSLGLLRMEMEYWTPEQVEFLKRNYKTIGDKELAIIFNLRWDKDKRYSHKHIEKKRRYLKLKRSEDEKAKIKIRNVKRGCFLNTTTWATRGVSDEGTIRIWKSQSGNLFKVIKVNGSFIHYNRWVYENHFGRIPKGKLVSFKDKNSLNVVPENLILLSRAQHVNHYRTGLKKYPEEIRELENILKSFNHILNKKSK